MKNLIIGILIAVFIFAGLTVVVFNTNTQKAEAFPQQGEQAGCTWGQIKVCMSGGCVEACCPENCKPYNQE